MVTCELGGTQGTDIEKSLEDAKSLSRADGINIIDCAMARLRINTFALAHIIQHRLNLCCIPHLVRRDRSILALQSDLLGAHCLRVEYVLATTGDPPQHGPYKDSAAVYNLNNENVPGINVPDEVISRFEKYGSGIPVACEFIDQIRDFASGIHILAMGNVENMNAIIDYVYGKR